MGKKLTHKDFLDKLYENNKSFKTGELEIIGEYTNNVTCVLVNTKHGICKSYPMHLLRGHVPTITSAIDKNNYFKSIANNKFNNLFDYSKVNYQGSKKLITITCKEHGDFFLRPDAHIQGRGCQKCGRISAIEKYTKNQDEVIKSFISIHGDKYDYSGVNYEHNKVNIDIKCNTHGIFKQTPHNHLQGAGCPKCSLENIGWTKTLWFESAKNSKKYDGFKVYVVKMTDIDNTDFYKVGRTFLPIKLRFQNIPYEYEVISIFENKELTIESAKEIYDLENKLHRQNLNHSYTPIIDFKGKKECFNKVEI